MENIILNLGHGWYDFTKLDQSVFYPQAKETLNKLTKKESK